MKGSPGNKVPAEENAEAVNGWHHDIFTQTAEAGKLCGDVDVRCRISVYVYRAVSKAIHRQHHYRLVITYCDPAPVQRHRPSDSRDDRRIYRQNLR